MSDLYDIYELVQRPSRYIGAEINSVCKPWEEAQLKVCLVYPDLYEIGMSHIGLLILYLILNQEESILANRLYAPARDLEALLRERKRPLLSLEHKKPLKEFDIVGISYPYELCVSNIINILDLSGIPIWSRDRKPQHPIILGGGSSMGNPEPVADFYDAIVIGEAEEAILEICKTIREWKKDARRNRKELLEALSKIEGVYIPSFFQPRYEKGVFIALEPLVPGYEKIKRRIIPELDSIPYKWTPPVPWTEISHDRLALEISRGCTRGCRFCQASSLYRPVRERSLSRLIEMAQEGLSSTGWDEVSFLSLSAGDYSCLTELVINFNKIFSSQKIALSLPSLRVGSLNEAIINEIKKTRKTGFTLAPEAATERLRAVINKDISEEALFSTALEVFEAGWHRLKLYFMIGLPTETKEDIYQIVRLARRLTKIKGRVGPQVIVSVSSFVPKAHTSFQWERQISLEEIKEKIYWLKRNLRGKRLKLKWHKPEQSFLEGVFSRGDRRLSLLSFEAFRKGARLDGWTEEFLFSAWNQAAKSLGLDLSSFLKERQKEDLLPWDHIDLGIKKDFLWQEREKGYSLQFSKDCRWGKCLGCGVCDFKKIKNRLTSCTNLSSFQEQTSTSLDKSFSFWYSLSYQKIRWARFLSQLEVMKAFHRAIRRAKLPVAFSKGFHPLPKLSFSRALPVGVESLEEIFALQLEEKLSSEDIKKRLNYSLPEELHIKQVKFLSSPKELLVPKIAKYSIELQTSVSRHKLKVFEEQKEIWLEIKKAKGKKVKINLKEYVKNMEIFKDKHLNISLLEPSEGGIRITDVIFFLLGKEDRQLIKRILKISSQVFQ